VPEIASRISRYVFGPMLVHNAMCSPFLAAICLSNATDRIVDRGLISAVDAYTRPW
jgi:hypothetical protein